MKITELEIKGLYLIECFFHEDERGKFIKTFNFELFRTYGISDINIREIYYSVSKKNTIRGMHFQTSPFDHSKIIYLTSGAVDDVILDLRINSGNYGKFLKIRMNAYKEALYIPSGCAHGFKALQDETVMVYNQTSEYNSSSDSGILYNSFGYDWQVDNPIISKRDLSFQPFNLFKSPFKK